MSRPTSRLLSGLAVAALVATSGVVTALTPAAPAAAATETVTLVGDLQTELGCTGDWQPECAATQLTDEDGDGVFTADFAVPAGDWEFKIAINQGWDESYGLDGGNYPLKLAAEQTLQFSFDDRTKRVNLAATGLPGAYTEADDVLIQAPFRDSGAGNSFYFVVTDRFENGDPDNDTCIATGHVGVNGVLPVDCGQADRLVTGFDPTDKGFFQGGDIRGLRDRLDYIDGLGLSAIWLTPSFVNRPVQGAGSDISAGYHGYWVTDFTQIDPHFGTNAELEALIDEAHAKGIKVYFDIIANHTADVIYYADHLGTNPPYVAKSAQQYKDAQGNEFDPSDYAEGTQAMPLMNPDTSSFPYDPEIPEGMAEAKFPLWLNDPTLYHNRGFDPAWPAGEAAVYMDFGDLDDLMTENQIVVDGMIDIYKTWADFGIDGFRIDTVKHVDFQFWTEFTRAIKSHAADDFFMFGEVYDADAKLLSPYVRDTDMNSVLDFAYQSTAENFAKGYTTRGLSGLFAADDYYTTAGSSASSLPTFLGNHDMGRIGHRLYGSSHLLDRAELAHELMFLTRGQPVVYYGDEQGFIGDGNDKDARESMFASQVDSYNDNGLLDGTAYADRTLWNTDYPVYSLISELAALRHDTPALATGAQTELYSEAGEGIYAFSRVDRADKVEHLVALNNAAVEKTVTFATLTPDATYAPLYGTTATVTANTDGEVTLTVPALSAVVFEADGRVAPAGEAQSISLISGAPADGLTPLTAEVASDRWAETSFSYRVMGEAQYLPLGAAETDQPRVFTDFGGAPAGTLVEVRAVSVDAAGAKVATSSTVVVGTELGATVPETTISWPGTVTIPGSHNAAMGCSGDWQPDCEQAILTLDEASGLYTGTFNLPAGSYEYKIAIGGSWDINYGVGGVAGGPNSTYTLAEAQAVTFFYNPASNQFFNNVQSAVYTLPGTFNAALGCTEDWAPACLSTLMWDGDGDGVYTLTTAAIPAGEHETKAVRDLAWGGWEYPNQNYDFTAVDGKAVTFHLDPAEPNLWVEITEIPLKGQGELRAHWIDQTTIAWPSNYLVGSAGTTKWELWTDPDGGMAMNGSAVGSGSGEAAAKVADLTSTGGALTATQLTNRGHLAHDFIALKLPAELDRAALETALKGDLKVVQRAADGFPQAFTGVQIPGVLDDLYADEARQRDLGPQFDDGGVPTLTLWAPTAHQVDLLLFADEAGTGTPETLAMTGNPDGTWVITGEAAWKDRAYLFDVQVFVPQRVLGDRTLGTDAVEHNVVSDPYSLALTVNSRASVLVNLDDDAWQPQIWTDNPRGPQLDKFVDHSIYELHIRDFSIADETVPAELRGTYEAFALEGTDGVARMTELAEAGMNTVHLLPSFDIATIPELRAEQETPIVPEAGPASQDQQAAVMAVADEDGWNWGYDPNHYMAPEGSYASDANQTGGARTSAFREMVGGLHRMGYQVVLDQVYNHTAASGQGEKSVLDKVVPGYYQRLMPDGSVANSTCCDNVATEHAMAEQLMVDSVVMWARDYKVDGFRFDLMGHHSRDNMLAVRAALDELTVADDGVDGSKFYLYGEGWDFGEVAGNQRFTQATQWNMGGTHIGSFNDKMRDAVHGPMGGDAATKAPSQGFGNGLYTDPNGKGGNSDLGHLRYEQDRVRVGMAGNLRSIQVSGKSGSDLGGYAVEPDDNVNYVDAHDNETLFDTNVWKLPFNSSMDTRIRMNTVSLATATLGQSPSFWHAGTEFLRSKSMDRNSYNSGDHFNLLDWSGQTNNFGVGLPPARDNDVRWFEMGFFLENEANVPTPADIAEARAQALELIELRSSHPLLRLGSAALINEKITFPNSGPEQPAGLILMRVDDTLGVDVDPELDGLLVAINGSPTAMTLPVDGMAGLNLELSPVHLGSARDDVVREGTAWDAATGTLSVPARSAVVLVQQHPDTTGPEITRIGGQPNRQGVPIDPIQIEAYDPSAPLHYSAEALPEGVTIDAATGLITGTPLVSGAHKVVVHVADAYGNTSSVRFTMPVSPAKKKKR